jgi:SpoVK/Ycf46/Vps4 family AAA+-type ATPase
LGDYAHISRSLDILCPYLKHAVDSARKGVNIYIHGAPGTGKTELAKVLAQELGSELFEVINEDDDGEPFDGEKRLRVLHLAQSFFAQSQVLILFDESEDVFSDRGTFIGSTARLHKAWLNRTLEENHVPVLWLSNSNALDPAFIRRFDMVIELPVPTKQQRKQIVKTVCGDMVTSATIERIANAEKMSPAVIARAASVLRCIEGGMESNRVSSAIEYLVSNTLEAQGHRPLEWCDVNRLTDTYDPEFIHADSDLTVLTQGLTQTKTGRLCLYGPPGTGKTAFARWLAEQLGIPLLAKRASDLMAAYVGETEQNIARAFREAEQNKSLLLIDEVDSFLQDRRGARHSWEVTAVNEMLTQMESFSGIFIASTNLMDNLDQAALRRFDLKVKFNYLKSEQAWQLLLRQCASLGIPSPKDECRSALAQFTVLTPGDFAAVARQHRFRPMARANELIAALKQECALKEDGKRMPIGFRLAN